MADGVVEVALLGQTGEAVDGAGRLGVVEYQSDVALVGGHADADRRRIGRDFAGLRRIDLSAGFLSGRVLAVRAQIGGSLEGRQLAIAAAGRGSRGCRRGGCCGVGRGGVGAGILVLHDERDDRRCRGGDGDDRPRHREDASLSVLPRVAFQLFLKLALGRLASFLVAGHRVILQIRTPDCSPSLPVDHVSWGCDPPEPWVGSPLMGHW